MNKVYSGLAQLVGEDNIWRAFTVVAKNKPDVYAALAAAHPDWDEFDIIQYDDPYEVSQLTINQLIEKLEAVTSWATPKFVGNDWEGKPFEYFVSGDFDSSRAFYVNLAIGWSTEDNKYSVNQLREELKEQLGKTYGGYKGGEFLMLPDTLVDCGFNWGQGLGGVYDVVERDQTVYLLVAEY